MWWIIVPWQILCCFAIDPLWMFTGKQLKHYFPTIKTKSIGRQAYIIKNIAKSVVLMFLTPPALWVINRIIFYNTWESAMIKTMGAMYAASDIVAVFKMFEKLPLTTKIHHLCVCVFAFLNAAVIDYNDSTSIWRNTAMLAAFSAPTYGVNTFLGLRCIDSISPKEKKRLANFALSIYSFFITASFIWQCFAFLIVPYKWAWHSWFYLFAVVMIYYDDYSLSRYLLLHSDCKRQ